MITDWIYNNPTWLLGVVIVGLATSLSGLGLIIFHRFDDVAEYLKLHYTTVYSCLMTESEDFALRMGAVQAARSWMTCSMERSALR